MLRTVPGGERCPADPGPAAQPLLATASGYALLGQDLHNASFPEYKAPLKVPLAPAIASALVNDLRATDHNVSGLLAFADGEPIALRWGEVGPTLWRSVHW